ncbi:MAG: GLPGLI family protein [Rikenellaceae bacterium]
MKTKQLISIAFFIFSYFDLTAQERGIRCLYELTYTRDTTKTEFTHSDIIVLRRGENRSVSYSQYTHRIDSLYALDGGEGVFYNERLREAILSGGAISIPTRRAGFYIFKDFTKQEVEVVDNIQTDYFIYDDQLYSQSWELADSTKTIAGYICNLAHCDFRGRQWSAWYTTEIPISDGPWKFCGLPGLILELYDREPHYKFTLISITSTEGDEIGTPKKFCNKRTRKTDRKKLLRAQMAALKDIGGYLSMSSSAQIEGVTESSPKNVMFDFMERDYK